MLEAELIISSDDLDEEYEMLQKKYGKEIDNIEFFMYIKRRVNAAYNKDCFPVVRSPVRPARDRYPSKPDVETSKDPCIYA